MRSTNVAEDVGRDCKKELLRRPIGSSDSGDYKNDSDVSLLLPFGGIMTTVVPLTPVVPTTIKLN